MKKWFSIALGIVTAIGGFLDAGTIATAGESGAKFQLGLIWAIVLATVMVILLVEMVGRFTAVSQKPYAAAIREEFGFGFYLLPLTSEIIAESLLLAAELGGMAIALSLFTGISWHILFPVATLIVFVMAWRAPFDWIENGPALFGLLMLSFVVGIIALGVLLVNPCSLCGNPRSNRASWLTTCILSPPLLAQRSARTFSTSIRPAPAKRVGRAVLFS